METHRRLAAVVVSTTSILSMDLFGVLNPLQTSSLRASRDGGNLTPVFANLPANAASEATKVPPADKNFLISQARNSRIRFVPPVTKNPRQSQGAGSRGCQQYLPGDLVTLLIPSKDEIAQTRSGHPSFFWHLSKPVSAPIQFTLVEIGVAEPLFVKKIDSPKAGMMQLELPKDRPELVAGRTYSWSVTLVCNARRPSANPYFYSWIERVPTTPEVEQQLAVATSTSNPPTQALRERALIYARSGLWYDALAAISAAQTANSNDLSVQEDFLSLLDQVGLQGVANQERQRFAQK
jgi:hypothetical protein